MTLPGGPNPIEIDVLTKDRTLRKFSKYLCFFNKKTYL